MDCFPLPRPYVLFSKGNPISSSGEIVFGNEAGEISYSLDVLGSLATLIAPGVQDVEEMGAFETVIVGRKNKAFFADPDGFLFTQVKHLEEHFHIREFETIHRILPLPFCARHRT